jgi:glycosyltransferase involved in cell wall biosynthesis
MPRLSNGRPSFDLSVVLPVYNEEAILERNVVALEQYLAGLDLLDRFEIILVCNGCGDDSERVSRGLADRSPDRVKALCLETRGLGRAIRAGIGAASYDFVMFYAVDLPFGLAVFRDSISAARQNRNRVVIGSKGHADSHVRRSLSRRLFSSVISRLNNRLFTLDVKDTQGSLLFPKAIFSRYHAAMDSPGAFFQTQIVIYGRQMGSEVREIPVRLSPSADARKTRFKLLGDGAQYVAAIFREKLKRMIGVVPTRDDRS